MSNFLNRRIPPASPGNLPGDMLSVRKADLQRLITIGNLLAFEVSMGAHGTPKIAMAWNAQADRIIAAALGRGADRKET